MYMYVYIILRYTYMYYFFLYIHIIFHVHAQVTDTHYCIQEHSYIHTSFSTDSLFSRACNVSRSGMYITSSFFTTTFLLLPDSLCTAVSFKTILLGSYRAADAIDYCTYSKSTTLSPSSCTCTCTCIYMYK